MGVCPYIPATHDTGGRGQCVGAGSRPVELCGVCTDTPGALLSPEQAAPVSGAKPTGEGGTTVALGDPATEGPGVTPGGSRATRGDHTQRECAARA